MQKYSDSAPGPFECCRITLPFCSQALDLHNSDFKQVTYLNSIQDTVPFSRQEWCTRVLGSSPSHQAWCDSPTVPGLVSTAAAPGPHQWTSAGPCSPASPSPTCPESGQSFSHVLGIRSVRLTRVRNQVSPSHTCPESGQSVSHVLGIRSVRLTRLRNRVSQCMHYIYISGIR